MLYGLLITRCLRKCLFQLCILCIHWVTKKHIFVLHTYIMNEYVTACIEQNTNTICSLLNEASFGIFCDQIGQLIQSHWVFKDSSKIMAQYFCYNPDSWSSAFWSGFRLKRYWSCISDFSSKIIRHIMYMIKTYIIKIQS